MPKAILLVKNFKRAQIISLNTTIENQYQQNKSSNKPDKTTQIEFNYQPSFHTPYLTKFANETQRLMMLKKNFIFNENHDWK